MKKKLIICLCLLSALVSCRKEAPFLDDPRQISEIYTFTSIFEAFWNGMNNDYAFWDIDPTDWDAVYEEYLPKFQELDSREPESEEETEAVYTDMDNYFKDMCKDLVDGHLAVLLTLGSHQTIISPSYDRNEARDYYHTNTEFLEDWVLANSALCSEGRLTEWNSTYIADDQDKTEYNVIGTGLLDGDIVYLRIYSYNISNHTEETDPVMDVMTQYYDYIDDLELDLGGVIIDVRGNGGGAVSDQQLVFGKLVNEATVATHFRGKTGPGRLAYGPWVPQYIMPDERTRERIDCPIVVLADINSVSGAEHTAMVARALPNGKLIGERTHGGHGSLRASNTGFYFSPGGYIQNTRFLLYTTNSMCSTHDGLVLEGVGVSPDIEVLYNDCDFVNEGDGQLERAIQFIRSGK